MATQKDIECAEGAYAVTKDVDYSDRPFRYLWVGTAGTLVVTMLDGSTATLTNATAGYHWLKGTKVTAASAADDITAFE